VHHPQGQGGRRAHWGGLRGGGCRRTGGRPTGRGEGGREREGEGEGEGGGRGGGGEEGTPGFAWLGDGAGPSASPASAPTMLHFFDGTPSAPSGGAGPGAEVYPGADPLSLMPRLLWGQDIKKRGVYQAQLRRRLRRLEGWALALVLVTVLLLLVVLLVPVVLRVLVLVQG